MFYDTIRKRHHREVFLKKCLIYLWFPIVNNTIFSSKYNVPTVNNLSKIYGTLPRNTAKFSEQKNTIQINISDSIQ